MDVYMRTAGELFWEPIRYMVPEHQSGYAWTGARHWEPLWNDLSELAEREDPGPPHFLGTIVLTQSPGKIGETRTRDVVDGQQRLMTLQILIHSAMEALSSAGAGRTEDRQRLMRLTRNAGPEGHGLHDEPKLSPSSPDDEAWHAMLGLAEYPDEHRVLRANDWLSREMARWLRAAEPGELHERAKRLIWQIVDGVEVVVVDLAEGDHRHQVVEALVGESTPVLQADLAKGYLMQQLGNAGERVEWPFDRPWWDERIREGRRLEARKERMLRHWLTGRRGRRIDRGEVFDVFRETMDTDFEGDAFAMKTALEWAAGHYRWLTDTKGRPATARTVRGRLRRLACGPLIPVLLQLERSQIEIVGEAGTVLERLLVRRVIARRSPRELEKLAISMVAAMQEHCGDEPLRAVLERAIRAEGGWPEKEEMEEAVLYRDALGDGDPPWADAVMGGFEGHVGLVEPEEAIAVECTDPGLPSPKGAGSKRLGNLTLARPQDGGRTALEVERREGAIEKGAWTEPDVRARGERMLLWIDQIWPEPAAEEAG